MTARMSDPAGYKSQTFSQKAPLEDLLLDLTGMSEDEAVSIDLQSLNIQYWF